MYCVAPLSQGWVRSDLDWQFLRTGETSARPSLDDRIASRQEDSAYREEWCSTLNSDDM